MERKLARGTALADKGLTFVSATGAGQAIY
jgi:hypothetical protein